MLLFGDLPEKISKACKSLELKLSWYSEEVNIL